jgi:hypothetical protein
VSEARSAARTGSAGSGSVASTEPGSSSTSSTPTRVEIAIRPGVTTMPAASTTATPAGGFARAATLAILPPSITTVAFSSGGPSPV